MQKKKDQKKQKPSTWERIKRGVDVAATAYTALNIARGVAAIVNAEKHKFDAGATVTPTSSGSITALSNIPQGDTMGSRHGNSVLAKSLTFKGLVTHNQSATNTLTTMYIIQDKQQVSDTAPAVADIFDVATYGPIGVLNANNVGRFKILVKKKLIQDGSRVISLDFFKKMNTHLRFNGTAGTDVQKGGLYLVLISNQTANPPSVQYLSRLGYYDN